VTHVVRRSRSGAAAAPISRAVAAARGAPQSIGPMPSGAYSPMQSS
jgi:hypothetical protein